MRILHIFDHSVPLHSGYTFRSLAILRAQRARGWETFQLTTPRHGAGAKTAETQALEESAEGLTFFRTPAPRGAFSRSSAGRALAEIQATARRVVEIVDRVRPDILHAHSPILDALPGLWARWRRDIPLVYEVRAFWEDAAVSHGSVAEGGARYTLTRAAESFVLKRADAVTAICEGLRTDIVARGIPAERVTVIPNAVDSGNFSGAAPRDEALAARLGLADTTVLGFIGSFYGYEGLAFLVRALPEILKRRPEVRLLLLGGGPEADALKALVAELGLASRVVMPGRVPHQDVRAYYALVDVFVYPRLRMRLTETVTPLKPLEAMAEGKIVLASDVGGHRELIEDGVTGTLFRADDATDLVAKVDRLLGARDAWPALVRQGRAFIERERTWTSSVARYEPVYEALVRKVRR